MRPDQLRLYRAATGERGGVTMRDYYARQAVAAVLNQLHGAEAARFRSVLRSTRDSDRVIQLCAKETAALRRGESTR